MTNEIEIINAFSEISEILKYVKTDILEKIPKKFIARYRKTQKFRL